MATKNSILSLCLFVCNCAISYSQIKQDDFVKVEIDYNTVIGTTGIDKSE